MRRVSEQLLVPSTATFLQDEPILASALTQIVDGVNTAERRRGSSVVGWSYPTPFEANQVGYAVTNGSGGEDLDARAPIVWPARVETDGLEAALPADTAHVLEFEVYGQNVTVELTLYDLTDGGVAAGAASHTVEITCGAAYERRRGFVVVERSPGPGVEAWRIAARAKSATSNGRVIEIVPHEAKMVSIENWLAELQVRGDEWVGMYVDTTDGSGVSAVDEWEPDGALFRFQSDAADPEMLRDVVAPGVHGVAFAGASTPQRLISGKYSFGDSYLFGVLFRPDVIDGTARYLFAKLDATVGATLRAYVINTGAGNDLLLQSYIGGVFNTINLGVTPTVGDWHDLVAFQNGTKRVVMLNGVIILEDTPAAFADTDPESCYLGMRDAANGPFDGVIALPEFSSAQVDRRELEMYAALRRSRHGRF